VALLAQEVGRGDAEQAGAEDDDVHGEHSDGRSPCPCYLRDSTTSGVSPFGGQINAALQSVRY
jgi:hypothetical protein